MASAAAPGSDLRFWHEAMGRAAKRGWYIAAAGRFGRRPGAFGRQRGGWRSPINPAVVPFGSPVIYDKTSERLKPELNVSMLNVSVPGM